MVRQGTMALACLWNQRATNSDGVRDLVSVQRESTFKLGLFEMEKRTSAVNGGNIHWIMSR